MEAALVVDCRQYLVDVGLEHHAAHNYLVEDVVNLPHGEGGREGGEKGKAGGVSIGRVQVEWTLHDGSCCCGGGNCCISMLKAEERDPSAPKSGLKMRLKKIKQKRKRKEAHFGKQNSSIKTCLVGVEDEVQLAHVFEALVERLHEYCRQREFQPRVSW